MRLAVGIGCDRGTPLDTLQQALDEALTLAGAVAGDVAVVASIDLKRDEPGIKALAENHRWDIAFYPAAQLAAVPVPHPSETVRRHTGTPSVAEAAALLSAGTGMAHLMVEKHKLRGPDGRNATISIARIPHD
ncbi:MAG: cobalamin biosynthesis protein [Sulfuricella sp.]